MTEIFKSGDASLKKCEVKEHSDVYGMFRDMIDATNKAAKKARTVRTSMVMRDDRLLSQGTVRQARIDFLKLRKFVSKEKDKKDKEKEREKEVLRGVDFTGHTGPTGRFLKILHTVTIIFLIYYQNTILNDFFYLIII